MTKREGKMKLSDECIKNFSALVGGLENKMTTHETDGEVTQEEMEIALEFEIALKFEKEWKYSSQPLYELVALALHQYAERRVAEERAKAEKLATCIPCPCGDVGYYVVPDRNTGEPEQEQCQFCDTNPDSRFKALKEWRQK